MRQICRNNPVRSNICGNEILVRPIHIFTTNSLQMYLASKSQVFFLAYNSSIVLYCCYLSLVCFFVFCRCIYIMPKMVKCKVHRIWCIFSIGSDVIFMSICFMSLLQFLLYRGKGKSIYNDLQKTFANVNWCLFSRNTVRIRNISHMQLVNY